MQLVWTAAAVIDLEQISDYLFEKSPEMAVPIIQRIFESASELKLFPRRGRPGCKGGTRELPAAKVPLFLVSGGFP
jgi:plasmid stabilization system protein ParE